MRKGGASSDGFVNEDTPVQWRDEPLPNLSPHVAASAFKYAEMGSSFDYLRFGGKNPSRRTVSPARGTMFVSLPKVEDLRRTRILARKSSAPPPNLMTTAIGFGTVGDHHERRPRASAFPRCQTGEFVSFWAGLSEPRHFLEMFRIAWGNFDNLGHAYRILDQGVCDGCALGTTGMRDWTIEGTHLCLVRLNLLRLNTMGPANPDVFADVDALRRMNGQELRDLGRIPFPLRRKKGEHGFKGISWDEALRELGDRFAKTDPIVWPCS